MLLKLPPSEMHVMFQQIIIFELLSYRSFCLLFSGDFTVVDSLGRSRVPCVSLRNRIGISNSFQASHLVLPDIFL